MNPTDEWDRWLTEADSADTLTPEGYDDHAAHVRAKTLRELLKRALATYEVRGGSTELYQDSTGLAGYRVIARDDSRLWAETLAWILLSHFGGIATVQDCHDPELLVKICGVLEDFGLKYIPYGYLATKTYDGKCRALVGFSWANRYFALAVNFNYEGLVDAMDLSNKSLCPKCGGSIEVRLDRSTQGMFCTNCDWAAVTSHLPEILHDSTRYEVRVTGGDFKNEQHLKKVAQLMGINFLEARKLLQGQRAFVVFAGPAHMAQAVRGTLSAAGLAFEIEPPFPW
jgi:hypothetical protein